MNLNNDFELVYMANLNDEGAKSLLYDKYRPLIVNKAKKKYEYVKNSKIDILDIIQEGMIGLEMAIKTYNEKENTLFYTFASLCIDASMNTYLKKCSTNKNRLLNEALSFEIDDNNEYSILDFVGNEKENPLYNVIERENHDDLYERIMGILTDKERQILLLKLDGFNYDEISEKLNIAIKSVYNTMQRIKEKVKKII